MLHEKFDNLKGLTVPRIDKLFDLFDKLDKSTENYLNKVASEVEKTQIMRKKDKSDHIVEFTKINKQISTQHENMESLAIALSNVGELAACLYEAHKISSVIESQDEEDCL